MLFDISQLSNFANDSSVFGWNRQTGPFIVETERELKAIVKLLKE
jgi:hypothetical protein